MQRNRKYVPLQCVFHSIRFKVNKGWSSAELLFLCPYAKCFLSPLSKDSYQTSFYGVADCRTFGHLSYFSLPAEIADEEAHPSTGARALHGWRNTGRVAERMVKGGFSRYIPSF